MPSSSPSFLLLPIVSWARQWLVAQGGGAEGPGAEPGCPGLAKTQAGTRGAGFNGSLVIGIAGQTGFRSQKVFRAGLVSLN